MSGRAVHATARRGLLGWLPLRVRISLWVLAIFAVVHVSLSLVVVLFQRQAVQREIESDLIGTAEAVAGESLSDLPGLLLIRVVQHARAAQWGPLASIVFDENGDMITHAGPYDDALIGRLLDHAAQISAGTQGTIFEAGEGEFFYAVTTLADGQRLVVAARTSELRRAVDPIMYVLLLTLPIGLVSTGVATWYISGIAVRPLHQMQSFAEELSAENVTARVDLDNDSPELEHLRDELEAAMRRIGEGYERQARFLANVSHELKTPISVVRTEAEVLLAGNPDEESLKEFARSASEEMDRLGRMIESFLLLTRIRHGTAKIKPKRYPANDILIEAVGFCTGMARQHGVRLVPNLCVSDDELMIEGNTDLLQTAICNLIRNAIRFSPKDSSVEIDCEPEGDHVCFGVRDKGPGVPQDLVDRIFEPFTQADEERRRGRGTGLGLQIAQGIAELHGGEIGLQNTSPGCRFTLKLPLVNPDSGKPNRE